MPKLDANSDLPKKQEKTKEIQSPCIRQCCLDNNDICVGCYRSIQEILGWTNSSTIEKQHILATCAKRRASRN